MFRTIQIKRKPYLNKTNFTLLFISNELEKMFVCSHFAISQQTELSKLIKQ